MITYTLTIIVNGEKRTATGRSAKKAYAAYDRAINEKIQVVEFYNSKGQDLRDRT